MHARPDSAREDRAVGLLWWPTAASYPPAAHLVTRCALKPGVGRRLASCSTGSVQIIFSRPHRVSVISGRASSVPPSAVLRARINKHRERRGIAGSCRCARRWRWRLTHPVASAARCSATAEPFQMVRPLGNAEPRGLQGGHKGQAVCAGGDAGFARNSLIYFLSQQRPLIEVFFRQLYA